MKNFVFGSVVLLAMAGTARGEQPKQPPKELTVDLGKGVKLELVLIPAGDFTMGSPTSDKDADDSEKPQHRVRITRPFYLGKYLVTQEQWEAVTGNNPSHFKGPKNPVETVSWNDCRKFCGTLNAKLHLAGGKFQLPTEAQWEYACRAGSTTKYSFGDDPARLGDYAWYAGNSGPQDHAADWVRSPTALAPFGSEFNGTTRPVGEKKPNAWGLYDMHGSVQEWCADRYDPGYYAKSSADDPTGPASGSHRMSRGGYYGATPGWCRSAFRVNREPKDALALLGFRVCRILGDWLR